MTSALAMYERALAVGADLHVVHADGSCRAMDLHRYLRAVDSVDLQVVGRCHGPTLDIGCGPGRFVSALRDRGVVALGVDVAAEAVAVARSTGAEVLHQSVFSPLPREGGWHRVLLLDENVGIGGHPAALLRRVRQLLAPDGRALIEVDPDEGADERSSVRLRDRHGRTSGSFAWARLGRDALVSVASGAGLRPVDGWTSGGRQFVGLAAAHHVDGT